MVKVAAAELQRNIGRYADMALTQPVARPERRARSNRVGEFEPLDSAAVDRLFTFRPVAIAAAAAAASGAAKSFE